MLHDRLEAAILPAFHRPHPRPRDLETCPSLFRRSLDLLEGGGGARRPSPDLRQGPVSTTPFGDGIRSATGAVAGLRMHTVTVEGGIPLRHRRATFRRRSLRTRTACNAVA